MEETEKQLDIVTPEEVPQSLELEENIEVVQPIEEVLIVRETERRVEMISLELEPEVYTPEPKEIKMRYVEAVLLIPNEEKNHYLKEEVGEPINVPEIDAGELIGLCIESVNNFKDSSKLVERSKGKCRDLAERLDRISKILQIDGMKEILNKKSRVILMDFLQCVTECEIFANKWGNTEEFLSNYNYQKVANDYDSVSYLVYRILGKFAALLGKEKEDAIMEDDSKRDTSFISASNNEDILYAFANKKECTSLIIWVDHYSNGPDSNSLVISTSSVSELKTLLSNPIPKMTFTTCRIVVIVRRTLFEEKDLPIRIDENSAKEIVQFVKEKGLKIPVFIKDENEEEINKWNNYLGVDFSQREQFIVASHEHKRAKDFIEMATAFFIWPDMEKDEKAMKLLEFCVHSGIVSYRPPVEATNFEVFIQTFFKENPHLKDKERFVNIIPSEFIRYGMAIRNRRFLCSFLFYNTKEMVVKNGYHVLRMTSISNDGLSKESDNATEMERFFDYKFPTKRISESNQVALQLATMEMMSSSSTIAKGSFLVKKVSCEISATVTDCNPMVVFKSQRDPSKSIRTPVMKHTLNPIWRNILQLPNLWSDGFVQIEIANQQGPALSILGQADLPMRELIKMCEMKKTGTTSIEKKFPHGTVSIECGFVKT